jgi:CDP-diacylglycerol--serine O-phosphatidyltransferase
MAFTGKFEYAMLFIVLGAVFDFFDGMVARLLGVSSPLGVQMDSLADDITFGLAPATVIFSFMNNMLVYPQFLGGFADVLPYFAFLIAVFSACRLAKFNIDTRQTTSFIGLPTPSNALFWSSLIVGGREWLLGLEHAWALLIALILLFSYFLISEIPMFSMKFKKDASSDLKWTRYTFIAVALVSLAVTLILGQHFSHAILFIFLTYILMNIVSAIFKR